MMTKEEYEVKWPVDVRNALTTLVKTFKNEQKGQREIMLREQKKLEFYWETLQNIYWDDIAHDIRPYVDGIGQYNNDIDFDEEDIGRVINVYRGFGESIIAGLSSDLPSVRFSPDDADNPDDISTAKAYGKIADLTYLHNNAPILFTKSLFILFNQSFVAAYNYYNSDPAYGTYQQKTYVPTQQVVETNTCPNCIGDLNQIQPDLNVMDNGDQFQSRYCPTCDQHVIPEQGMDTIEVIIEQAEDVPKGREIIEIWGSMNVNIPFYVSSLVNAPYLILENEYHISFLKSKYPWIRDEITASRSGDTYDRFMRRPVMQYTDEANDNQTLSRTWLRPWTFEAVPEENLRQYLYQTYPEGVYVALVGDVFAEAYEEDLDEHWTISESPISTYIHMSPMGRVLVDIQEMTNDVFNLTVRTINYGVPMTFVDADAIEWDKFQETENEPGYFYPIKVKPGQNASNAFHEVKAGSLSKEVSMFSNQLTQAGQFVSGAFPSIYGGTVMGGSHTYKEYESSRNQALQRLSLTWKMLNIWWKDVTTKCCKEYAINLNNDEKYAQRSGNNYVSVWIKRSELQGKIGQVEAESSNQFPTTMQQKRDLLLSLFTQQGPLSQAIMQAAFHPENVDLIARILGFDEIYVPGGDQREKQIRETLQLSNSQPIPSVNPQTGQQIEVSSVPIEEVDDDSIHIETVKAYLVSDIGQFLKETNPAGYQNNILHMQAHQQRLAMQQQQQMEAQNGVGQSSNNGGSKPEGNSGGDAGRPVGS